MTIKFITSNDHKFTEVKHVFEKNNLTVEHLKMKYTELQADSIEQIALASASSLSTIVEGDFMIEDAGLFVDSLNGFPGPYSSYIFQSIGCQGILDLLGENDNLELRQAYFASVFVMFKNGKFNVFKGRCDGIIPIDAFGKGGFGFDPIFIPADLNKLGDLDKTSLTFAEMGDDEKNKISHRSRSITKLISFLNEN